MKAGRILSKVSGIIKIYSPWIHVARSLGRPFYEFAYDWRRDLNETSVLFEEFLKNIQSKHNHKIQVVAHSMGGLITFSVLNRNHELFQSVLFAGVPFLSGIGILEDFHYGQTIGRNSNLMGPYTYFSFCSPYVFLPFKDDPKMFSNKSEPLDIDFFSVDDWINNKLGVFADKEATEEMKTHLAKALERNKLFKENLIKKDIEYPPIAILASKSHPTMRHVMKDGPKSKKGLDFETMPKAEGDGRVTFIGSLPYEGIPYDQYISQLKHNKLVNDPILPKILADLINKAK